MQSMLIQAGREVKKPAAEDVAISNLLEIDFKEQEDASSWGINRPRVKGKGRNWSLHQYSTKSNSNGVHVRKYAPISSFSNYAKEDVSFQANSAKANNKFNEGEYWSSKITWTTPTHLHIREHSSQPKLNKKYTFGYQVNGRKRKNNQEERSLKNDYKAKLIYSLLNHQDVVRYKQQQMVKLNKSIDKGKNSKPINNIQNDFIPNCNLQQAGSNVEQYPSPLRKSIKKFEDIVHISQEQNSQRNLMMIKQLLMDLQFMKKYDNQSNSNDKKVRVNRWNIKKSMVKIQ